MLLLVRAGVRCVMPLPWDDHHHHWGRVGAGHCRIAITLGLGGSCGHAAVIGTGNEDGGSHCHHKPPPTLETGDTHCIIDTGIGGDALMAAIGQLRLVVIIIVVGGAGASECPAVVVSQVVMVVATLMVGCQSGHGRVLSTPVIVVAPKWSHASFHPMEKGQHR